MKTQLSLNDFAKEIVDRSSSKRDFITDSRNLVADAGLLTFDGKSYAINEHCHSQIADRLGIPLKYYRRMLKDQPELWSKNLNTWFQEEPDVRMVRTLHDKARAYLSDRFLTLDDDEFANTVFPVISEFADAQVLSCGITDLKTHIKFASPRLEREVKKGDVVQFGIAYSNSEVGAGRLTGSLFIHRLACLNGAVVKDDVFAQNHVGRKQGNGLQLEDVLEIDTIQTDARATMLKLRDYSKAILTDEFIDRQVVRMQNLTEIKVEDPIKAVELVTRKNAFSEATKNNILSHLITGGDLSMWGLHNAVTRASADEADYDEATRMETIGGDMLFMPAPAIKELAIAA